MMDSVYGNAWKALCLMFLHGKALPEQNILRRYGGHAFDCLRELKAIEAADPLRNVTCPCCGYEIIEVEEDENGMHGYCPDCCEVPVSPRMVRRWGARERWMLREMARAFGIVTGRVEEPFPGVKVLGTYQRQLVVFTRDIYSVLLNPRILARLRPGGFFVPWIISGDIPGSKEAIAPVGARHLPMEMSFSLSSSGLTFVDVVEPEEPGAVTDGFTPDFLHFRKRGAEYVEFSPMQAKIFGTLAKSALPMEMQAVLEKAGTQFRTFNEAFKVRATSVAARDRELRRKEIAGQVIVRSSNGRYVLNTGQ